MRTNRNELKALEVLIQGGGGVDYVVFTGNRFLYLMRRLWTRDEVHGKQLQ